jgi:hypothetical protein
MPKERVLITVKTYPTLSRKYGETVCTAGVREDGSWVRIYPVPFRRLEETQQYSKYDWIEADFKKSVTDPRPETYHPVDMRQLVPFGHVASNDNWRERRRLLIAAGKVHTQLEDLIAGAKANKVSLATFKPSAILEFIAEEEEERGWNVSKMEEMRSQSKQGSLFEDEWRKTFEVIPKLPYKFSYRFEDAAGRISQLRILDWEIGALFWNCLRRDGNEKAALEKVRAKYFGQFLGTDLHFFLGTTLQYHQVAPNPWVIIGVFPAPHQQQGELFG